MLYKEFITYCDKKKCLRRTILSKRCSMDYKRQSCYEKFLKQEEKNKEKILKVDEEWQIVKKQVWERDNGRCRVLAVLDVKEYGMIKDEIYRQQIDTCHVISRAQAPQPELYYNPDNLFLGLRIFHSRLDTYKDPITNKAITQYERNRWMIRIIGSETWRKIQRLHKNYKPKGAVNEETQ
jgi:hypothetical protein